MNVYYKQVKGGGSFLRHTLYGYKEQNSENEFIEVMLDGELYADCILKSDFKKFEFDYVLVDHKLITRYVRREF